VRVLDVSPPKAAGVRRGGSASLVPQILSSVEGAQQSESLRPFASVGAGAFFGRLRIVGERVSVGVADGSTFIQLSLLNASGGRDPRDVQKILSNAAQHASGTEAIRWSESNRQIALMAGMTSRIFMLDASLAIGPSYMLSTVTSIDPTSGTIGAPHYSNLLGASAQASLAYSITRNLQTGLMGVMNYHGWGSTGSVSGAILMSVSFELR
jgi:ethanolamine utilization microcompartment shell protein EutL